MVRHRKHWRTVLMQRRIELLGYRDLKCEIAHCRPGDKGFKRALLCGWQSLLLPIASDKRARMAIS